MKLICKVVRKRLCIVFSLMLCLYVICLTNIERKQLIKHQMFTSQFNVRNQGNCTLDNIGHALQQNLPKTANAKNTEDLTRSKREENIAYFTKPNLVHNMTAPEVHSNRVKELEKSFGNRSDSVKWYFTKRNESKTYFQYDFLHTSNTNCSKGENPFLVILCLSQVYHIVERETIRATWASVVHTKHWPRRPDVKDNIKFVFVIGRTDTKFKQHIIDTESEYFGDIIQGDFIDTYNNLTIKVLMGLKWSFLHCQGTKYLLKMDEDTFIHVANLVNFLHMVDNLDNGTIIGWVHTNSRVIRNGKKWSIPNDLYPFENYPKYTSGGAYIISGNIIGPLLDAAKYLPNIINEDVFITGVARIVVGAEIQHSPAFTMSLQGTPRPCSFLNDRKIAATNTNVNINIRIWAVLNTTAKSC